MHRFSKLFCTLLSFNIHTLLNFLPKQCIVFTVSQKIPGRYPFIQKAWHVSLCEKRYFFADLEMMHHFAFSLLSISSLKLRRWHDRNILFICTFEGEVKYCVCSRWNVQVTSHANIVIPQVRFSRFPIGISNMTMKFHASVKFDLLLYFSSCCFLAYLLFYIQMGYL